MKSIFKWHTPNIVSSEVATSLPPTGFLPSLTLEISHIIYCQYLRYFSLWWICHRFSLKSEKVNSFLHLKTSICQRRLCHEIITSIVSSRDTQPARFLTLRTTIKRTVQCTTPKCFPTIHLINLFLFTNVVFNPIILRLSPDQFYPCQTKEHFERKIPTTIRQTRLYRL